MRVRNSSSFSCQSSDQQYHYLTSLDLHKIHISFLLLSSLIVFVKHYPKLAINSINPTINLDLFYSLISFSIILTFQMINHI